MKYSSMSTFMIYIYLLYITVQNTNYTKNKYYISFLSELIAINSFKSI